MPRGTIQKAVELLEAGRKGELFYCFGNGTAVTLHRGKGVLLDHQELWAPRWPQPQREGHLPRCLLAPSPALFQEALQVQTEKAQSLFLQKPTLGWEADLWSTRGFHAFLASAAGAQRTEPPTSQRAQCRSQVAPDNTPQVPGQSHINPHLEATAHAGDHSLGAACGCANHRG